MTTYQDKKGKTFATRQEAKASNLAQTADNVITNGKVAKGTLPANQAENTPQDSSVINSNSLKSQPSFDVPQSTPSTAITGEIARFENQTDQYTKNLETKTNDAKTNESDSFESLMSSYLNAPTATGLEAKAYGKKGGVDDIQTELDSINNEIRGEQHALRRKLEAIDEKGGGLQSGANAEKRNLERESFKTQADLSIIQMGVQGRFDSAKAIADRVVKAQTEEAQKEIDVLGLVYNRNKALFDTAEQRAFESAQTDRQNALNTKKEEDTRKYSLVLDAQMNGAPQSVLRAMMASKTGMEASALGSEYIGKLDREAKEANIAQSYASMRASDQSILNSQQKNLIERAKLGDPTALKELGITPDPNGYIEVDTKEAQGVQKEIVSNDAYKAIRKGQDSLLALTAFEKLFKAVGTTSGVTSPIENRELKATYNASILNLKEFFNLGVLNGPDEAILKGVLPDPTGQGFVTNPFAKQGTVAGIQNMKDQIEQTLDDRYLSVKSQYSRYNPDEITVLNDLDRVYLQNKMTINPSVSKFIEDNPDMPLDEVLQVINSKI